MADYETYYDNAGYSLTKIDPASYILDSRFECIGCSYIENGGNPFFVDGPDVPRYLSGLDAARTVFVSHNVLFDGCIAAWRHGFVAGLYIDTLHLARALLGHKLPSCSLKNVARHLGLPPKGDTSLKVAGMRRADIFNAGLMTEYIEYCKHDSWLCHEIYKHLLPGFPNDEIKLADMVARMAIEPTLRLDRSILETHHATVLAEKATLLGNAGLDTSEILMSNAKLAKALEDLGIDVPLKISPATGKPAFAFARSDEEFRELENHPSAVVQALVAARLGHKSTIEETRTRRFMTIAGLANPRYGSSLLPWPLKSSGAHTHRLSGDWKLNCQNMPRSSRRRPVPALRKAVIAPPGYLLVVGDEAQVECRINASFCGQRDLEDQFRKKQDPYSIFASRIFGKPITKADVGPRFIGKQVVLGAGYQVWWPKYQRMVATLSSEQLGQRIEVSDADALMHISTYRDVNYAIRQRWAMLQDQVIPAMTKKDCDFELGPFKITFECVTGPSGLKMHYRNLSKNLDTEEWLFMYGATVKKLFGGKLLENMVQHMAYVAISQAALRLKPTMHDMGARWVLQCHDELGYLVPERHAALAAQWLEYEMTRPLSWLPTCPLAAEVHVGLNYADVK